MAGCWDCFGPRRRARSAAPPVSPPESPSPPGLDAASAPAEPVKIGGGVASAEPPRDPLLSSLSDPSGQLASRDLTRNESKKQRQNIKRNPSRAATGTDVATASGGAGAAGGPQDNNGLSRGQNYSKVEKWLRESAAQGPRIIVPGVIFNIEDHIPGTPSAAGAVDPPSEADRLPPMMPVAHSQLTLNV